MSLALETLHNEFVFVPSSPYYFKTTQRAHLVTNFDTRQSLSNLRFFYEHSILPTFAPLWAIFMCNRSMGGRIFSFLLTKHHSFTSLYVIFVNQHRIQHYVIFSRSTMTSHTSTWLNSSCCLVVLLGGNNIGFQR